MADWWWARVRSFEYAFRGVAWLVRSQPHAKVHAVATGLVVALGWWWRLDILEWGLVVVCIGCVWGAEAFNTALEQLTDLAAEGQWHPLARNAKDVAAGAVLLVSAAAALVGVLIFGPKLLRAFGLG